MKDSFCILLFDFSLAVNIALLISVFTEIPCSFVR